RTTEFEGGFEVSLLNDRVGLEFTGYIARTKDALVTPTLPPSMRFGSSPQTNIGGLENKGWEAALRLVPIQGNNLRWSTDIRLDGNSNEVTDLGMDPAAD